MGDRVGGHPAESEPGGIRRTHREDRLAYFLGISLASPKELDRLVGRGGSRKLN